MSSYKVIAQVSNTLQTLLWSAFQQDSEFNLPAAKTIVFKSPAEAAKDSANLLSIWLYDITQNEYIANQPMRAMGAVKRQAPPLSLNLHYMITPLATTEQMNLFLLAKTMQVFHDNNTLLLEEGELRIIPNQESLEDMSRIWQALHEPYRLAICYQVKTVRIDSAQA